MADIVTQLQYNNWDYIWDYSVDWGQRVGQEFVAVESGTITKVYLLCKRIDSGWTADYRIFFREKELEDYTGNLLGTVVFNSSTVPVTSTWLEITFPEMTFTAGQRYNWRIHQNEQKGDSIIQTPKLELYYHANDVGVPSVLPDGLKWIRSNIGGVWSDRINHASSFTIDETYPPKPTNVTPTDTGTGIVLLPDLIWEAG